MDLPSIRATMDLSPGVGKQAIGSSAIVAPRTATLDLQWRRAGCFRIL
jgi:hypothetical protein